MDDEQRLILLRIDWPFVITFDFNKSQKSYTHLIRTLYVNLLLLLQMKLLNSSGSSCHI